LQALESEGSAEDDLRPAIDAVRQAGEKALELFGTSVKTWHKSDGTPVTEVDIQVDQILRRLLRRSRPDYGWHSEESDISVDVHGRYWLVDPIDGTAAFLGRNDSWCISLALIENGRPTVGIIYAPAKKLLYSSAKDKGAKLNGVPIFVSRRDTLEGARLLSNVSAIKPQRWRRELPRVARSTVPSLALRLAEVAQGSSDAALALSYKHDWDLAAGDLLVHEAQGIMSDLDGRVLHYDPHIHERLGFIAGTPGVHAALLAHGPLAIGRS
jgi:myo-inositol-1(or 4)-monophosphatase